METIKNCFKFGCLFINNPQKLNSMFHSDICCEDYFVPDPPETISELDLSEGRIKKFLRLIKSLFNGKI